MNRQEFLARLRKSLKRLPAAERDDAVRYYEEYLDDAGPEGEASALAAWGTPEQEAARILADCAEARANGAPKRGLSAVTLVILAICAAPIAAPLAVTAVALIVCLVALAACVVAAVGVAACGLVFGGACYAVAGFSAVASNPGGALFFVGVGLFWVGAGLAAAMLTAWLGKQGFRWVAKLSCRILPGRRAKA